MPKMEVTEMNKKELDSLAWFLTNFRTIALHHSNYIDGCKECEPKITLLREYVVNRDKELNA